MTSHEQEALSRRYAFRASVVPLEDGSFAVFALDLSSESLLIVENPDDLAFAIVSRANMLRRKTPSKDDPPPPGRRVVLDFDETDFEEALG
jgi:hypothetical protein